MRNPKQFSQSSEDAVELQDIWFSYSGKSPTLTGVSFSVKKGSASVLVGPNGSGKTTILKLIRGILKPQRGVVRVFGEGMARDEMYGSGSLRRGWIGYIPQQLGLVRNLTVLENVLTGALSRSSFLTLLKLFPKEELEFAWSIMEIVGIAHRAHEKVYRLSGGERQRVAVARAMVQKPRVILADEFTSDLDYIAAQNIMDLMSGIRKDGVTLIMATHNLEIAMTYGEQVILLKNGVNVGEMKASELSKEVVRRIFVEG